MSTLGLHAASLEFYRARPAEAETSPFEPRHFSVASNRANDTRANGECQPRANCNNERSARGTTDNDINDGGRTDSREAESAVAERCRDKVDIEAGGSICGERGWLEGHLTHQLGCVGGGQTEAGTGMQQF